MYLHEPQTNAAALEPPPMPPMRGVRYDTDGHLQPVVTEADDQETIENLELRPAQLNTLLASKRRREATGPCADPPPFAS